MGQLADRGSLKGQPSGVRGELAGKCAPSEGSQHLPCAEQRQAGMGERSTEAGASSWLGPLVGPSRTLGAVSEGAVLGRSGAKLSNLYGSSGVVSGVVNRRYCMRYWFCSARVTARARCVVTGVVNILS